MSKSKKPTTDRKASGKPKLEFIKNKAETAAALAKLAKHWGVTVKEATAKALDIGIGRKETLIESEKKAAKKGKKKPTRQVAKRAALKKAPKRAKKDRGARAPKAKAKSKRKPKAGLGDALVKAFGSKPARKALTAEQKAAKTAKDRERRAAKKSNKTSNGVPSEPAVFDDDHAGAL